MRQKRPKENTNNLEKRFKRQAIHGQNKRCLKELKLNPNVTLKNRISFELDFTLRHRSHGQFLPSDYNRSLSRSKAKQSKYLCLRHHPQGDFSKRCDYLKRNGLKPKAEPQGWDDRSGTGGETDSTHERTGNLQTDSFDQTIF